MVELEVAADEDVLVLVLQVNANHTIIPITRTWSMYAFVGPNALNYPVFYSAKRILGHRGNIPNQQSLTYYTLLNYYWDIDTSFYKKLIQGLVGENLLTNINVADFVDQLYVYMNWMPDPPGDPQWDGESRKGKSGLGVIEITLDSNTDEG